MSVYGSAFCFEAYVKGYTSKPDGLTLSFDFSDGDRPIDFNSAPYNVVCHYDEADSSGWHRIWATIPYCGSSDDGNVCIQYIKSAGDNFTALYFDDVILRPLPVTMIINDITSNFNNSVSLNSTRVKGYDIYNNERDVVNTQLIKWSVLSGSASIDSNNNLIYSGASSGNVKLKADFYGITAQTTVQFGTSLNVSEITKIGNSYKTDIINTSRNTVNASIIAALYDGNRLYNVYNTSKSLRSGETANIMTPEVNIPKWVKNPVTKVYVWDELFGMRAYSDAEDLFFNFTDNFSYDQNGGANSNGQVLTQNWQNFTGWGSQWMSTYIEPDRDNAQNMVMVLVPAADSDCAVNLTVAHFGISPAKIVQVDICGLDERDIQRFGLNVMTESGESMYQLSCNTKICTFLKSTNGNTPASDTQSSTSTMSTMNTWYTFKLILNGAQVSWSITQKGGGYSWSGSFTDTAPLDASSVQVYAGGHWNPAAYFDNFILKSYYPSVD